MSSGRSHSACVRSGRNTCNWRPLSGLRGLLVTACVAGAFVDQARELAARRPQCEALYGARAWPTKNLLSKATA
jgi:hypothetical protein